MNCFCSHPPKKKVKGERSYFLAWLRFWQPELLKPMRLWNVVYWLERGKTIKALENLGERKG